MSTKTEKKPLSDSIHQLRGVIIGRVAIDNGCKSSELPGLVYNDLRRLFEASSNPSCEWHYDLRTIETSDMGLVPDIIEKLIKEGELLEIKYTFPSKPERHYSFILPKEAQVRA
jgi:hypothetical protein